MTYDELSQFYAAFRELERTEEMLESLRSAACPGAQVLSGMPIAPGYRDKLGDYAVEIADLDSEVERLRADLDRQRSDIEQFISTIPDVQARTIFRLRFLRGKTWKEVAALVGGGNTESNVKAICYRYLKRRIDEKM